MQALRHETGACYYVLAKQVGNEVAYLRPDCTADYRREGRLWLSAQPVIDARRRWNGAWRPGVADEFHYYLVKKVLKQEIDGAKLARLAALLAESPEPCRARMARFWPPETVAGLAKAVRDRDLSWMRAHLPRLLSELRASPPVEGRWQRLVNYGRECRRKAQRAANPTGVCISVHGGSRDERSQLAAGLERNLRGAFRRTRLMYEGRRPGLGMMASLWLARVRSTLVVRTSEATGRSQWAADEMRFVLDGATGAPGLITLHGKDRLADATRISLDFMARRLRRRGKPGRE